MDYPGSAKNLASELLELRLGCSSLALQDGITASPRSAAKYLASSVIGRMSTLASARL
jgi:hypothetical protein